MATTAIWDVKGWLGKLVIYVENPAKTMNPKQYKEPETLETNSQGLTDVINYAMRESKASNQTNKEADKLTRQYYVTGINCTPSSARDEMLAVKKRYGKEDGIIAFHGYQSFAENEVSPDLAHTIGVALAKELWGERFQVIVATHLDKENHIHNHFVLNSVSFMDGYRYNDCTATYLQLRKTSDRICKEHRLSIIENPKRGKGKQYGEWRADKEGRATWRGIIKQDIDETIAASITDKQFFYILREKGYTFKFGKDITLRPQGKERGVKLVRNFGDEYSYAAICNRILNNSKRYRAENEKTLERKPLQLKGTFDKNRKIGGLRGLYLYYCFKLGVFQKNKEKNPNQKHFLLREDLRKLDTFSKETKLLCRHHIDTVEQLSLYRTEQNVRIEDLYSIRKHLRYQTRSIHDEKKLEEVKNEITNISRQLASLRKEVGLCNGIEKRCVEIKSKLKQIRQEEQKGKEEHSNEYRRRSSRSDR